ncbi:hypothetical protein BOTBODRAFT_645499 [Botryobasidium botryosum FD-172 SS1]|uniref:Uncharacterized protein n=1 Tax=Botryobasidium botryosum (strain FD-172 SS1) TaxID=930990 RepID=A0A067LZ49_BOTB1|nr:hypothetical protein BOTBODRAFT_645499 [Botryobasidium botryosum FD-172 SS1]
MQGLSPMSELLQGPLIHRLPDDALLEVFGAYYGTLRPRFTLSDALRLSDVCHLWRALARRLPCFWSHLKLNVTNREVDHRAAYWLGLSRKSTLFIAIHAMYPSPSYLTEETEEDFEARLVRLAQVLQPDMNRWEFFSIRLQTQNVDLFLQHCSTDNYMSHLKTFKADYIEGDDSTQIPVCLRNIPYDRPPNSEVNISAYCDRHIPTFASNFGRAMTSVSVDLGPPANTFTLPIPLLHLRHLFISGIYDLNHILASLYLPSLESLKLHDMDCTNLVVDSILEIFRRCHSSLSHIDITNDEGGAEDINGGLDIPNEGLIVLTSLKYCCIRLSNSNHLLRWLVLSHIEALNIANVRFDIAYPLISSSTRLRTLTLDDIYGPTTPALFLPALTILNIGTSFHLLDLLLAPELTSIKLRGTKVSAGRHTSLEPLCRYVECCTLPLRLLHLESVDMNDVQFLWCMERLTELESLTLAHTNVTDAAFFTLAKPLPASSGAPPSWVLPRLRKIDISGNDYLDPPGFIEFIASRNGPGGMPAEAPEQATVTAKRSR